MGLIFNDFNKNSIEELLKKNNIAVDNNYLLVTKNRGIKEGIMKLLVNNTYNAIDGSRQYLLVFTSEAIYETKVSGLKREEITFNKYKHDEISNFNLKRKFTKYIISWQVGSKNYAYEVDKFQGIYSFIKHNFNDLQNKNFYF